jgi:hypothetical protein
MEAECRQTLTMSRSSRILDLGFMMKCGHPLREIPGAPSGLLARLRDELSVTTAEELVALWRTSKDDLLRAIGDSDALESLAHRALDVLPPEEVKAIIETEQQSYPYATGHEAPPKGRDTY